MAALLAPLHASALEAESEADSLIVRWSRRIEATISLRDYLTFDKRTLGLSRILLGFLLIGDLFHRGRFWLELYSDAGILPRGSVAIKSSIAFSIFNAFGSPGELYVLFALMLATFACLLVGYKTRVAQVLALVFVTSMDARTSIIDNAGYIAESLLLLWTCFLPLGDRFSLDSILAAMKRGATNTEALERRGDDKREDAHLTLVGPIVLMQLAVIYYMAWIHKTGESWIDGKGVHYAMYCDRMIRPIVAMVRDRVPNWVVYVMSHGAMLGEALLAFVILSPFFRVWSRRVSIVMIAGLHIGFGVMLALGPFSWTMCVFASLLFSAADWDLATRTMRRTHRARTVIFAANSARAVFVCRLLKHLDAFDLLSFRAGDAGPLGIAVKGSSGRPSEMVREIVDALPLGPLVALPLRMPILRNVADLVLARIAKLEPRPLVPLRATPPPAPSASSRVARVLRELGALVMFGGAVNQVLVCSPILNEKTKWHLHEPFETLTRKFRFFQGWNVMAPQALMNDGVIVVDAITVDGRHVDPLSLHAAPYTLRAPNFDLAHAKGLGFDQVWIEYLARMSEPRFESYHAPLEAYLLRLPQRTGHAEDAIVSADVYWIGDQNPRWDEKESWGFEQKKLFSFTAP